MLESFRLRSLGTMFFSGIGVLSGCEREELPRVIGNSGSKSSILNALNALPSLCVCVFVVDEFSAAKYP